MSNRKKNVECKHCKKLFFYDLSQKDYLVICPNFGLLVPLVEARWLTEHIKPRSKIKAFKIRPRLLPRQYEASVSGDEEWRGGVRVSFDSFWDKVSLYMPMWFAFQIFSIHAVMQAVVLFHSLRLL